LTDGLAAPLTASIISIFIIELHHFFHVLHSEKLVSFAGECTSRFRRSLFSPERKPFEKNKIRNIVPEGEYVETRCTEGRNRLILWGLTILPVFHTQFTLDMVLTILSQTTT